MSLESAIYDLIDKEIILMKPERLSNVLLKNYGILTDKDDINVNYSFYCMELEKAGLAEINVTKLKDN